MREELATVLRLVAEGKLSPEEAAPLIDALGAGERSDRGERGEARGDQHPAEDHAGPVKGRRMRIQVSERGRRVVDLRVPLGFAAMAARAVPGLPNSFASLIEQAVESNTSGTIVDTEDDGGDRVLITVE